MKGYSSDLEEECARARTEGVNASYRDLTQVCSSIRGKKSGWAVSFLEKASVGEVAVLYRSHNKNLGHRRELGGRKGRYPEKAARFVLKTLMSAIANAKVLGFGSDLTVAVASANMKEIYPRMAPKGRRDRSNLVTSRIEIVVKGTKVPKGVSVTAPAKKAEAVKIAEKAKAPEKTAEKPAAGSTEKTVPPRDSLKDEGIVEHEHKHETEKEKDMEKGKKPSMPHQHGEETKR
jgi:ribosomal protein L22